MQSLLSEEEGFTHTFEECIISQQTWKTISIKDSGEVKIIRMTEISNLDRDNLYVYDLFLYVVYYLRTKRRYEKDLPKVLTIHWQEAGSRAMKLLSKPNISERGHTK